MSKPAHGAALRLAIAICMLAVGAASAGAEPEAAGFELNIGSQPLDSALLDLARQSGVQILFFSKVTSGLRAPALTGRYTIESALTRLLGDSGLTFRKVDARTVEVRQSAAATIPPVAAKRESTPAPTPDRRDDSMDEVVVMASAEQLVATRVPTLLKDIPQSISIVSREQLRQQNAFDLADAMAGATGIMTRRSSAVGYDYYARGFSVLSFHVDGGAALSPRQQNFLLLPGLPDLSEFEYVEVLRGADALFTGNANPGGTVSLVRKRPHSTYQSAANFTVGSWNSRRAEIDVTGPIALDGALRGRADAVYWSHDYFYDGAHFDRRRIFGVLEWDLSPGGTLTAGGSYQWDDGSPWYSGLPPYSDGTNSNLPRRTSLLPDWATDRSETREAYVQYRQQIAEAWRLKLNVASWRVIHSQTYANLGPIDRESGIAPPPTGAFTAEPVVHHQDTADVTLVGTLNWWGMREQIAVGGDFTRFKADIDFIATGPLGAPIQDYGQFDRRGYTDPRRLRANALQLLYGMSLSQYGAFASLQVDVTSAWSATGGLRVSSNHAHLGSDSMGGKLIHGDSGVINPYGGLIYRINERYSWYASYAGIYLTTEIKNERVSGGLVGPERAANLETGIKGAWRDGALNGSLALYRIAQRDVPRNLVDMPYDPERPECCFSSATARSRGAEIELSGEVRPGWLVGTGYTYNEHETVVGSGQLLTGPRHLLKLWTSLQLPGELGRWSVGGDVQAQSRTLDTGEEVCYGLCEHAFRQAGYALLNLRAAFRIDRNWQVTLGVKNLFDRTYLEAIDAGEFGSWYGAPRNFTLRVDGKF